MNNAVSFDIIHFLLLDARKQRLQFAEFELAFQASINLLMITSSDFIIIIQCGIKLFTSSYLCITLVKIRNAALQKKRKPNLKIYPNSKCDLLRRDDMNAKLRLK
jgi:predicted ABC-type sugar transport system permease subunit